MINRIASTTDANLLLWLERLLELQQTSDEPLTLLSLAGAVKEKTVLAELIEEQQYRGPDREAFDKAVEELGVQEPIDVLLTQLTKCG